MNISEKGKTHIFHSKNFTGGFLMDKHEQFKNLYRKYVDGTRWLNAQAGKGVDVTRHRQDFDEMVVKPMDAIWSTLTPDEKESWEKINKIVKMFNGRIL